MSKALGKAMAWERSGRVAPKRDERTDAHLAILYSSTHVHKRS